MSVVYDRRIFSWSHTHTYMHGHGKRGETTKKAALPPFKTCKLRSDQLADRVRFSCCYSGSEWSCLAPTCSSSSCVIQWKSQLLAQPPSRDAEWLCSVRFLPPSAKDDQMKLPEFPVSNSPNRLFVVFLQMRWGDALKGRKGSGTAALSEDW